MLHVKWYRAGFDREASSRQGSLIYYCLRSISIRNHDMLAAALFPARQAQVTRKSPEIEGGNGTMGHQKAALIYEMAIISCHEK